MPRGKAKPQVEFTATPQEGDSPPSKMEAVRRALEELGDQARPPQIQEFLQANFGFTMPPNHISSYKSSLLKKRHGPGRRKDRTADGSSAGRPADGLTLRDIRAIKEMSDRIGPQRFRELVELLS